MKKETKNKCQCPLSSVQPQDQRRQSGRTSIGLWTAVSNPLTNALLTDAKFAFVIQFFVCPYYVDLLGTALSTAPRPSVRQSVCPSHASDFLETEKPVETSN